MGNRLIREMTMAEIEEVLGCKVKLISKKPDKILADIHEGETFKIGPLEFIVLEHIEEGTRVLLKSIWKKDKFSSCGNHFGSSRIRSEVNEKFLTHLKSLVDAKNIVPHATCLTADDGRKEYKDCKGYISLLTTDLYRKYVDILDKYNPESSWWLATACSTLYKYNRQVVYVNSDGTLCCTNSDADNIGIRPYCILKSSTIVE